MDIEDARPGLAYVMRELGATRWREDRDGYIVSVKIGGRRRCRNYLVSAKYLVPVESELAADTNPLRVKTEDFTRLEDSDY